MQRRCFLVLVTPSSLLKWVEMVYGCLRQHRLICCVSQRCAQMARLALNTAWERKSQIPSNCKSKPLTFPSSDLAHLTSNLPNSTTLAAMEKKARLWHRQANSWSLGISRKSNEAFSTSIRSNSLTLLPLTTSSSLIMKRRSWLPTKRTWACNPARKRLTSNTDADLRSWLIMLWLKFSSIIESHSEPCSTN